MSIFVSVDGDLKCFSSFREILSRSMKSHDLSISDGQVTKHVKVESFEFVNFSDEIFSDSNNLCSLNIIIAHIFVIKQGSVRDFLSRELVDWMLKVAAPCAQKQFFAVIVACCDKTSCVKLNSLNGQKLNIKNKILKKHSGCTNGKFRKMLKNYGLQLLFEFGGGTCPLINHSDLMDLTASLAEMISEAVSFRIGQCKFGVDRINQSMSESPSSLKDFISISLVLSDLFSVMNCKEKSAQSLDGAIESLWVVFSVDSFCENSVLRLKNELFRDLMFDLKEGKYWNLSNSQIDGENPCKCEQLAFIMRLVEKQLMLYIKMDKFHLAAEILYTILERIRSALDNVIHGDLLNLWLLANLKETYSFFGDFISLFALLLLTLLKNTLWWYRNGGEGMHVGFRISGPIDEFYLEVVDRIKSHSKKYPMVVAGLGLEVADCLMQLEAYSTAIAWLGFSFSMFSSHSWTDLSITARKMKRQCHVNINSVKDYITDQIWLSLNTLCVKERVMTDLKDYLADKTGTFEVIDESFFAIKLQLSTDKPSFLNINLKIISNLSEQLHVDSFLLVCSHFTGDQSPDFVNSNLGDKTRFVSAEWARPFTIEHGSTEVTAVVPVSHVDLRWKQLIFHVSVSRVYTIDTRPRIQLICEQTPQVCLVSKFELIIGNVPPGANVAVHSLCGSVIFEDTPFLLKKTSNLVTFMALPLVFDENLLYEGIQTTSRKIVVSVNDYVEEFDLLVDPLLQIQCSVRNSRNKKYLIGELSTVVSDDFSIPQNISLDVCNVYNSRLSGFRGVFRPIHSDLKCSIFPGMKLNLVWELKVENTDDPCICNITALLSNSLADGIWHKLLMQLNFSCKFESQD